MSVVLIARVNLSLQVVMLGVLFLNYLLILRQKSRFFLHGSLMLVLLLLNYLSFFLVMGPSFAGLEIVRSEPLHEYSLVIITHAVVGALAMILATAIVASWRLQRSAKNCIKRKRLMRVVLVFWTVALVFGVWVYYILYGFS